MSTFLITEGLGGEDGALTLFSATPDVTSIVLQFSNSVVLTGAAANVANWVIAPGITVLSVTANGTLVTIVTTEHVTNVQYVLTIPQGIIKDADGTPFGGPFTVNYTGIGSQPVLLLVRSIDVRHVQAVFNEPVLLADIASNYTIAGPTSINVLSVETVNPQTYILTTTPHDPQQTYTLTATNVTDLMGNSV